MKKTIYLLSLMLSGMLFIACGENESDQTLTFDTKNVEMIVGYSMDVNVNGGISPYTVKSANEEIAKATVKGKVITVNGLKEGKTSLNVTCSGGAKATLAIAVVVDPYEGDKKNVAIRVKWDAFEKTDGKNKGIYTLTKAEDKTVTFSWTNEEDKESLTLSFSDKDDVIGGEKNTPHNAVTGKSLGKLKVTKDKEVKEYDVTSWRLVQAKPADEKEGTPKSYWITFTANGKTGIFVAPLTVAKK